MFQVDQGGFARSLQYEEDKEFSDVLKPQTQRRKATDDGQREVISLD